MLQSDNPEQRFFGAQILYNKTEYCFHKLSAGARNELREYAYKLLVQLCTENTTTKAAMSKLAATCAIIGCSMMSDTWTTFLGI